MKKISLFISIISIFISKVHAQNTFPATGNVGVGTTSPVQALQITGGNVYTSSNNSYLQISGGTSGTGGYFQGTNESGTNAGYGPWVNSNAYWNGTNWIQPRGSISSYLYSANHHLGFIWEYAADGGVDGGIITPTEFMRLNLNGKMGIGTGATISAKLHIISMTQQFRLGYDAANFNSFTVDSNGDLTIAATGTNPNITLTPGGTGNTFLKGNVGIGTTDTKGYKLGVNGSMIATSVTVKLNANWPDYVFKPTYKLPLLSDVKNYIDRNHHLADMPTEEEVSKNGINLGEVNKVLTKKVEELTLYLIALDEKNKSEQQQIDELKKEIEGLVKK